MVTTEEYVDEVIRKGDKGSALLRKLTAPTLYYRPDLVQVLGEGMNETSVLRVPQDQCVVVHAAAGNPQEKDLASYTASLVQRLVQQARDMGVEPVAFSEVVGTPASDPDKLTIIGNTLTDASYSHRLVILNGENAVLGERVTVDANISGVMISLIEKKRVHSLRYHARANHITIAVFDPQGRPVYMNNDGEGTKAEFYERLGNFKGSIDNLLAMNLDDTVKL